jgi:hypothetical protein
VVSVAMGEGGSRLSDFVPIGGRRWLHEDGGFDGEGEDVENVTGAFAFDRGDEDARAGGVEWVLEHGVAERGHGGSVIDGSETVEDHEGLADWKKQRRNERKGSAKLRRTNGETRDGGSTHNRRSRRLTEVRVWGIEELKFSQLLNTKLLELEDHLCKVGSKDLGFR